MARLLEGTLCATPAACATMAPVERGGKIAIVAAHGSEPAIKASAAPLIYQDARIGLGMGSMGGSLAGLACGPFALLCVPGFAAIGGLAGGVAGGLAGAAEASHDDTFQQLDARLRVFAKDHNPRDCVIAAVR